jgi:hypothetical protein
MTLACAGALALFALLTPAPAEEEAAPAANPTPAESISREDIARSPFSFELPARHGNEDKIGFADLVLDTNAVIFLWTTDCPLCKLEVRHMNNLAAWAKEHPQANLRKEAAAALGEISDPGGRQFLEPVLDDPDPEVRKNARWAMQQIVSKKGALGQ